MTRTARRQKLFALFALMLTSLTFFAAATSYFRRLSSSLS